MRHADVVVWQGDVWIRGLTGLDLLSETGVLSFGVVRERHTQAKAQGFLACLTAKEGSLGYLEARTRFVLFSPVMSCRTGPLRVGRTLRGLYTGRAV